MINNKEYIQKLIKDFLNKTKNKATLNSRSLFVRENLNTIKELTNYLPENVNIKERLYNIFYNLCELDIICPICKENNKRFYTFTKGYWATCSRSCATKFQQKYSVDRLEVTRKCIQTMSNKTADEKSLISKKRIQTMIEKYGQDVFSINSKNGYLKSLELGTFVSGFKIIQEDPEKFKQMHLKAAQTMKNKIINYNGELINHYQYTHKLKIDDIDENGNNFYERQHLKNLNDIDNNGDNYYERRNKFMFEKGFWTKPEDMPNLNNYRYQVGKFMKKYFEDIKKLLNYDKRGLANKGLYHLDHKFSIVEGFNQNILPCIIGSIYNLEMILGIENISKNKKCSISKEELFRKYFENI